MTREENGHHIFTSEDIALVDALRLQVSIGDIAKRLKIHHSTAKRLIQKLGGGRPGKPHDAYVRSAAWWSVHDADLVRLVAEKWSETAIAKKLGIHRDQVAKRAIALSLPRRKPGWKDQIVPPLPAPKPKRVEDEPNLDMRRITPLAELMAGRDWDAWVEGVTQ